MSRLPKCSCACWTAAKPAARSVTSSWTGSSAPPYFVTRSSRLDRSRAVAATRSPRSSAAMAPSRPKPREHPVMNQVRGVCEAVTWSTVGLRAHSKSKGRSARKPVRAFLHQGHRSGQPPGLEGELRELVALHAVEVHHHPAEAAGRELHLEDVGPLPHQRRLLGEGLLEPDRPGRLPEVAEGPAGDLELGVARVLRQLHLVELPHQVEEVRDRGHAFSGTSKATHSMWCVIGKTPMALSVSASNCRGLRSYEETSR